MVAYKIYNKCRKEMLTYYNRFLTCIFIFLRVARTSLNLPPYGNRTFVCSPNIPRITRLSYAKKIWALVQTIQPYLQFSRFFLKLRRWQYHNRFLNPSQSMITLLVGFLLHQVLDPRPGGKMAFNFHIIVITNIAASLS